MISGSQVYQVARSVARGDGEWAEVPRCVREAIVLSLAAPGGGGDGQQPPGRRGIAGTSAPASAPTPPQRRPLPPVLSEAAVQRSVRSFNDGAWVRDQAVRSYAQFHNSVESLHTSMRGQLRALWRTAMQLNPRILDEVRREHGLGGGDAIPDGVPIRPDEVDSIVAQERVLDELAVDLQQLRDSSVRLAAHWLTDREIMAMGANPAYLRPSVIDHEVSQRSRSRSRSLRAGPSPTPRAGTRDGSRSRRDEAWELSAPKGDTELRELRRQYAERLAAPTPQGERRARHCSTSGSGSRRRHRDSRDSRRPRESQSSRHRSDSRDSRRHCANQPSFSHRDSQDSRRPRESPSYRHRSDSERPSRRSSRLSRSSAAREDTNGDRFRH